MNKIFFLHQVFLFSCYLFIFELSTGARTLREKNNIGTRNVFSGNLLRHPAYLDLKYKTAGKIISADCVMKNAFWLGVFPGITDEMIKYVKKTIKNFLAPFT